MILFSSRWGRAVAGSLLAGALVWGGMGVPRAVAGPPQGRKAAVVQDLPNFHTVAPGIYRGGVPTEEGLRKLRAMGVQTVVDLRISPKRVKREGEIARGIGFEWLNLPMSDAPPTKKQVATLLTTLNQASPAHPVFVHCEHGADRTGCMVGIWRVSRQGWAFAPTFQEMRQYGFNPHYTKLTGAVRERAGR